MQRRPAVGSGYFGDFGVSFIATVAGLYTRRGGRLSVLGLDPTCSDTRTILGIPTHPGRIDPFKAHVLHLPLTSRLESM